jgi:hypothetical protein
MQLKDGTTLTKQINETAQTDIVTFATPFAIPAASALEVDCLAACGPFNSENKRMLVLGIKAQSDFTAALTLVDEASELSRYVYSPSGDVVMSPSGDFVFTP